MKRYMIIVSALLVTVLSCTKEIAPANDEEKNNVEFTLTVGLDQDTKATLDGATGKTVWNTGDKICVNGIESGELDEAFNGKSTATFTFASTPTAPFNVCYPSECWEDDSHINLPAVQGNAQGENKALGFPMAAQSSALDDIVLKHVCSYVKFQIKGTETLQYVEFRGNKGEQVSGSFGYDFANGTLTPAGDPSISDKYVRVSSSAALSSDAQYCIVALPAATYSGGFNLRVITNDSKYFIQNTNKSKSFARAELTPFSEFTVTSTGKYWEIKNALDWNNFATNYTENSVDLVEIANDIDFGSTVPATVNSFGGTLNGQGYTLSGIASTAPLFTSPTGATISNLTLDGAFTFTLSGGSDDVTYAAPLAGYTKQCNISNVTNKASVSVTGTAAAKLHVGGIVGQNHDGTLNSCVNEGAITVSDTFSSTSDVFIGGMYGFQSGSKSIVNNALNKGDITCKGNATNFYIGGIFGSISNGHLSETINRNQCVITSEGAKNLCLGGLYGTIQIETAIHHPKATPFSEAGKKIEVKNIVVGGTIAVGGLIGRTYAAFNFDGVGLTTMSKAVTVYANDKVFSSGTIAVGGFIGLAKEALTAGGAGGLKCSGGISVQLSDSYTFYPNCGIGGIVGIAQKGVSISNCSCATGENYIGTNTNSAKQNSTNKMGFGGLVGIAYGGNSSISGCEVEAKVNATIFNNTEVPSGGPCIGGVIGEFGLGDDTYAINISNCTVSNTNVRAYRGYGGGIAGYISANSTISTCLLPNVSVSRNANAKVIAAVLAAAGTGASVTNCGISGTVDSNALTGTDAEACPVANVATGTYLLGGSAKKLSIIGDSISTYEGKLPTGNRVYYKASQGYLSDWTQTYWGLLCNKYMKGLLELEKNISWSGSCVAQDTRTGSDYRPAFVTRYNQTNTPSGQTYDINSLGNPDIVIIFGGTNDKSFKANGLTDVDTTPSDSDFTTIFAKSNENLNTSSFVEAYVKLVKMIHNDCPDAKILNIIGDAITTAQVASIKKISDNYTFCKYIDFSNGGAYNTNIPKASGVHPNAAGMDYIASQICNQCASWMLN